MTDADVRQNRTTDLSSERLDELEDQWNCEGCIAYEDMLALIAQARRTEQAERERDALRAVAKIIADAGVWDWHTELSHWVLDGMPDDYDDELIGLSVAEARAALAQPTDAGGA